MFLKKRSYEPEIIDDFSIDDERIDKALSELNIINSFLGGYSVTKKGLNEFRKMVPSNGKIKILDVGAGGSDLFILRQNGFALKPVSLDKNIRAAKFLKRKDPRLDIVCADAFNLPFKPKSFDVVHASLFLHHFKEKSIGRIFEELRKISIDDIIVNDLRRSYVAYLGISILTGIFSKSKLIKNDGPLSVKRSFKRSDLKNIFNNHEFSFVIIKRNWAFRWLIYAKFN